MSPSQTMIAARRDALRRQGKEPATPPDGWRAGDTAPLTGSMIKTRKGHIMRWMPYRKNSAERAAGIDGRWQIWLASKNHWMNVDQGPTEWLGYGGKLPASN